MISERCKVEIRIVKATETQNDRMMDLKNVEFIRKVQDRLKRKLKSASSISTDALQEPFTCKNPGAADDAVIPLYLLISSISSHHHQPFASQDQHPMSPKLMERILVSLYNLESEFYSLKQGEIVVHSKLVVLFPDSSLSLAGESRFNEEELIYYLMNDFSDTPSSSLSTSLRYDNVVLGGTFDYLHAGHKILLSMASWFTSKRLVVGVSGMISFSTPVFDTAAY